MFNIYRFFSWISLIATISSCSSYSKLNHRFRYVKHDPISFNDSITNVEKLDWKLYIEPIRITDKSFPNTSILTYKQKQLIPLIVYNIANYKIYCEYGDSMSAVPIHSLADQISQYYFVNFSQFRVSPDVNNEYRLRIIIDSIKAYGTFCNRIQSIFNFFLLKNSITDAKVKCNISFLLYNKDKLLFQKQSLYQSSLFQDPTLMARITNLQKEIFGNQFRDAETEFSTALNFSLNLALQRQIWKVRNELQRYILHYYNQE